VKTSYFARIKSRDDLNLVSISRTAPPGWNHKQFKKLAPDWEALKAFKSNGDEERFTNYFKKFILDELDAEKVLAELGEDAVLVCWEGADKFCHRRIVAEWLEEQLDIEVPELMRSE